MRPTNPAIHGRYYDRLRSIDLTLYFRLSYGPVLFCLPFLSFDYRSDFPCSSNQVASIIRIKPLESTAHPDSTTFRLTAALDGPGPSLPAGHLDRRTRISRRSSSPPPPSTRGIKPPMLFRCCPPNKKAIRCCSSVPPSRLEDPILP